jgi:dihydroceramidase
MLFMYLAFKGIRSCLVNGHDTVYIMVFLGYLLVGTGSFLFHTTLKCTSIIPWWDGEVLTAADPMQLVDELSMIYTTCLMCYATFSYNKSQQYRNFLGTGLVSLSVFITLYYHYLQDPTFHQNAYAILTAIVIIRSMYVMEVNIRPRLRSKEREAANPRPHGGDEVAKRRADEEDVETLRLMWKMVALGLTLFLGGFALWNVDNEFCSTLTRWRREIGMPWSFVLEGHGWW